MTHKQKAIELLSQMPKGVIPSAEDFLDFGLNESGFDLPDNGKRIYIRKLIDFAQLHVEAVIAHYEQLQKENEELKRTVEKLESDIELFGQLNTKTK